MKIVARVVAITYAVYLAAAVLVISPLLNVWPATFVMENYQRSLQTRWVYFNPFTLSLNLSEAQLFEPHGDVFVGLGASSINLSVETLWKPGIVLDEINIKGISLTITHLGDDEFNFSSLLSAAEQDGEEPEELEPLGITIHSLYLQATDLNMGDEARTPVYQGQWRNLEISGKAISTVYDSDQPYQLNITAPGGGTLSWEGDLSVVSRKSSGRLSARSISLVELSDIADPWIHFSTTSGELDLDIAYELAWLDAPIFSVENSRLQLRNLNITDKESQQLGETRLELKGLTISSIQADSQSERAVIGDIAIAELDLAGWYRDERFSLAELFTGAVITDARSAESSEAEPAGKSAPDTETDNSTWEIVLENIQLANSSLTLDSDFTQPEPLQLAPIDARLTALRWPFEGESDFDANITINGTASLSTNAKLKLASGDIDSEYSLSEFHLPLIDAALPEQLHAVITDGKVSARGLLSLSDFKPKNITSSIAVSDFALQGTNADTALMGWDTLELNDMSVNFEEQALSLAGVNLNRYNGVVHIDKNGSLNLANLWHASTAGSESSPEQSAKADGASPTPTEETSATTSSSSETQKDWAIDVAEIVVSESTVDFTDQSLPVIFRTTIKEIEGKVKDLNSKAKPEASVDIKGTVNGYSPVQLVGTLNPLAEPASIDLALNFKGLDMAGLSPYAATYAGREIDSGLLDANLSYRLNGQNLDGQNRIRMEELKLGNKVKSDKAVDLPLDLALTILTNSDGIIELKVPVKGDVSQPGFRLGSVISKALFGIIRETVTAPFTLLANLVGSDQDFRHINFAAGSSTLDAQGTETLESLVDALRQRPSIKLRIFGRINQDSDGRELKKQALNETLLAAGLDETDVAEKNLAWEREVDRIFRGLNRAESMETPPTLQEKFEAVLDAVEIPDEQLLTLSSRRSIAVQNALINTFGLEESRIRLKEAEPGKTEDNFGGVLLSID